MKRPLIPLPEVDRERTVFIYGCDRTFTPNHKITISDRHRDNNQYWKARSIVCELYENGFDTFLFHQMGKFEMMVHRLIHYQRPKPATIKLYQMLPYRGFPEYDIPPKGLGNITTTHYYSRSERRYGQHGFGNLIEYMLSHSAVLLTNLTPAQASDHPVIIRAVFNGNLIMAAERV